jgi:glycolate oxidase FAD binding subunit
MNAPPILRPETEAALAEIVRDAAESGTPLGIEGRGSKAVMLRPVDAARILSTSGLAGISLYAPKELILGARAGTPVAAIETELAAAGQHLIAEPPDLGAILGTNAGASIGGTVAANLSGPRRIAWGATRDHVMGIRMVNGSGEVLRSGGRVLKNVTGLDLCKLLSGSFGTLGVLTEVILKVLPAPERSGTLVVPVADATAAVGVLSSALGSPYGVSGAAFLPAAGAARLGLAGDVAVVRIEDFAASVQYRLMRLRDQHPGDLLDDAASRALWRGIRDAVPLAPAPLEAVWRVSVRPSAGPAVLRALAASHHGFLDWGGGLAWLAGPATAEAHRAVCAAAAAGQGSWMLLRAPEALRATVAVVPPEAAPLAAITARVKAALDPRGVLNPGKMTKAA